MKAAAVLRLAIPAPMLNDFGPRVPGIGTPRSAPNGPARLHRGIPCTSRDRAFYLEPGQGGRGALIRVNPRPRIATPVSVSGSEVGEARGQDLQHPRRYHDSSSRLVAAAPAGIF